ncbi:MAG: 4-hydroxy-tetrahydrodipicolinate reductase [Candidatus Thorarchaeota archaeon]
MAIRVVVNGALGRMGEQVVHTVLAQPDMKIVGAVEVQASQPYFPAPECSELIPFSSDLGSLLERVQPDVVVDFTRAQVTLEACRVALPLGVNVVSGTTGLGENELSEIGQLCDSSGKCAVVAPNFSLGVVVLMHLAKIAARYFDNVEIIEMHHDKKLDAPSGTALATARLLAEAKGKPFVYPATEREVLPSVRGGQVDGVAIHSVRVPGIMASQEVIFGGQGQTLSLRHDVTSRESYMPGVMMAVRESVKRRGLIVGLDKILEL